MVYSISSQERSSSFKISETITSSASVTLPVVLYYLSACISNLQLSAHRNTVQEAIIDLTNKFATAQLVNHQNIHHIEKTLFVNELTCRDIIPESVFPLNQASWPMSSREKNRLTQAPIR